MTKIGLRIWIQKVSVLYGNKRFTFGELPEELRSRADIRQAVNSGYLVCVFKKKNKPSQYQVSVKARRWLQ